MRVTSGQKQLSCVGYKLRVQRLLLPYVTLCLIEGNTIALKKEHLDKRYKGFGNPHDLNLEIRGKNHECLLRLKLDFTATAFVRKKQAKSDKLIYR